MVSYRREFFPIVILAGAVSWAAFTLVVSYGNLIRFTRELINAGYLTQWLAVTILPGAISAALIAPFFLRDMLAAMESGADQSGKARFFGMCIGLSTCVMFPITGAIISGITEGFDQLGDQKGLFVVVLMSFFGVVPAMLIGALVARVVEARLRRRLQPSTGETGLP